MPRVNGEPTIALAGGGSGGHLYPALAVADMLRSLVPNLRVLFFGTRRPIDSEILSAYSGRLVRQSVRPFPRRPWNVPGFLMGWWRSTRACARTLDDNPPLAVLGTGGYASAPAIVAAAKAGIPTALLNPDAVPGKANRMLGSRVDAVFAQWAETQEHFNGSSSVHVTGCPIRPEFKTATRDEGIEHFGLDPDRKVLLVTGASQGARSVNEAVTAAVPLLHERRIWDDWQLLHLTGIRDEPRIVETYDALDFRAARVVGYTKHMAAALAAADLIVSRSGASTLAEITAMGRASVLMPYPHHRDQHQVANARVLVKLGAARIVLDRADPGQNAPALADTLLKLMQDESELGRLAGAAQRIGTTNAAKTVADKLLALSSGNSPAGGPE